MVKIYGGAAYQRDYVRSIAEFCVQALMPRLANKVLLHITLSNTLRQQQDVLGYCTWEDTNHLPRVFTIEIDSTQRLRMLLITVAHEIVHAKQFARNEQKQTIREGNWKWMGRTVDTDKVDYWELPWEIEANGRETGLFINWCIANDLQDKHWTHDLNEKR